MLFKNLSLLILSLSLFSLSLLAQPFSKTATNTPVLIQKGKQKEWCPVCGMSLKKFYKTSHTSQINNHKDRQYCSLRCLAVDNKEYKIDTQTVKVVDAKTEQVIDASSAFYVVGSKVRGTMTKVSKLAFKEESDAKEFIKKYRGKIVSFEDAFSMAKKSLQSDIAMVTNKKEKKIYPMGRKIFEKRCNQDIDPNNYIEINELKADIKKSQLCKPLKEKQLQAVALYLFEVKRFGDLENITDTIKVSKDEKCPICGMFVYKYPRWAAQIFYGEKHYSFDGVKDLLKYYFDNKENITKILVTDYYSQKAIDAQKAYYVVGSDIYGPMGNELIPFKRESDAKTFYMDHRGTEVIHFQDIKVDEVYQLDE
ncbi:MAG: nitrous oxide reductase accessory protein NosL [Campylobacterota bacterium]|nr:nitrous oxide reductase accessory protein NosL [Campylobacterota bacterium]